MPEQAASAPGALQIIASKPIPVDITSAKALTIEVAKVPDGKPFDPHWTTYVQAIGTPIVAVIAAAIAATIQYRQWKTANAAAQTAKNKLKLDLFERRFDVFTAASEVIEMCSGEIDNTTKPPKDLLYRLSGAEFLFNQAIGDYLDGVLIDEVLEILELVKERDQALKDGDDNHLAAIHERIQTKERWFRKQPRVVIDLMRPFLQLDH
jgi:hypothetical protein